MRVFLPLPSSPLMAPTDRDGAAVLPSSALADFVRRQAFLEFSPADVAELQALHDLLGDVAPGFVDAFYDHLARFDEIAPLIASPGVLDRLKLTQRAYFDSLTAGPYDASYLQRRLAIGMAHARVGLAPAWYLGAYSHYLVDLLPPMVERLGTDPARFVPALQALMKVVLLDIGLAIDSYIAHRDQQIARLQDYVNVFTGMPFGTLVLSGDLKVLYANRALGELIGTTATALQGLALGEVVDLRPLQPLLARMGEGRPVRESTTLRVLDRPSEVALPVGLTLSMLPDSSGLPGQRLLLVVEDLRLQARLETDLLNAQAVAAIGSWHVDLRSGQTQWSDEAYRLYGREPGGPVNYEAFLEAVHPEDREEVDSAWRAALAGRPFRIEHRVVRPDGTVRWVESRGKLQRGHDGRVVKAFGTVYDITERRQASERIQRLAFQDTLTGLPNRTLALDRLQQALAQAERDHHGVALLYVDLDHFKEINDTQGHLIGDQVLADVASRLNAVVRQRDTLARLGGDEFVLLGPSDAASASQVAERLLEAVEQPVLVNGVRFTVGMSIGIALYPEDGRTAEDLLKHADTAMYRAKAAGGGTMRFYHAGMSEGLQRRMLLATRLKSALHARQLSLHFQPQFDLSTGALCGAEALARWHDPEAGWIAPSEFIPVAETRGLIDELGDWALSEAARQVRAWDDAGLVFPGRVAVNVSARQMTDEGFVARAVQLVHAHGITPQRIELEVTESSMMQDPKKAEEQARALVAAGFVLSIDDFGTGYSSLAALKRLPVSKLKIDMSFVRDMLDEPEDHTIVHTIISMARALRLRTLAEGVEHDAQADVLQALGCDQVQGWYRGRAVPGDVFATQWLTD
ncbi:diguanylate cyclase [Aquabacterium olei]|uniref:Diguanylate cyclase DosC n=2 Tax=Aquabacterium olei TaxID=1296669 RepID=A0A2U8FMA7_9BURK|nr:diguanylate cyclase [Aquabacterium olei]